MIIQIMQTAALLGILSIAVIKFFDTPPVWVMALTLFALFGSFATVAVCTLIEIWT